MRLCPSTPFSPQPLPLPATTPPARSSRAHLRLGPVLDAARADVAVKAVGGEGQVLGVTLQGRSGRSEQGSEGRDTGAVHRQLGSQLCITASTAGTSQCGDDNKISIRPCTGPALAAAVAPGERTSRMVTPCRSALPRALSSCWGDWSMRVMLVGDTPALTMPCPEDGMQHGGAGEAMAKPSERRLHTQSNFNQDSWVGCPTTTQLQAMLSPLNPPWHWRATCSPSEYKMPDSIP